MRILLISTYEMGRQPFGLASPAAWLRCEGHDVACADLSRGPLPVQDAAEADLVAFYLPMHTATRLAVNAMAKIRALNPRAHICCYGLYAPMNEPWLRQCGAQTILGGEFEDELVRLARGEPARVSLERLRFRTPDRTGLPPLSAYVQLKGAGTPRRTGYTEASRGCKHLCRHCPIVPVYNGQFRIVQREVVLADVARQVEEGAEHITFGDPDFFNGPGHAVAIVEALHERFPALTYDVTIKIEHLLKHRDLLSVLRKTGCLFLTTAVESLDDAVLERLAKGHTRADFIEAVRLMRETGLALAPTFIAFTPWTTRESYRDLLRTAADLGLIPNVASVQWGIRLLIPAGSRLLELAEIRKLAGPFNPEALAHPWKHPDPEVDALQKKVQWVVGKSPNAPREETFRRVWELAFDAQVPENYRLLPRAAVPYLNEPWYC